MSNAQILINKFADTHPLPSVVSTVTQLINDPESTMKDFEEVIQTDPILVSRLLRLVNSPYYGLSQTVDSISRAVAFLGMKNLHNLVVTDALKGLFDEPKTSSIFSKKRLWAHSAAVSISSKMVAERIFGVNGDDAFLCGILHDFGLLVEEQNNQTAFNEIADSCSSTTDFVEQEQEQFGTDHCEIGFLLTKDWNMAATIQEAIRDHHLCSDEVEPSSLTGITQIAEYLSAQIDRTTLPEITTEISAPLIEHIKDNMDEYTVLLEDLPEEMEKADAIYG